MQEWLTDAVQTVILYSVIPFFELPAVPIGPFRVQAFSLLTVAGIGAGYIWLRRRLRRLGEDAAHVPGMVFWILLAGFAGALALKLLYLPSFVDTLRTAPRDLLRMVSGIASFGGLFAGLASGCIYLRWSGLRGATVMRYLDALAFVFPRAWLFGRIGCALAHDHAGIRTQSWLGVRYPDGTRWDLGLLEVFFTLAYLGLLAFLDRRKRPNGLYLGLFLCAYAAFRLGLDRLHENPVRYFGWTVDQYGSTAALAAGLVVLLAAVRREPASVSHRQIGS